jgi:hypothetical protein
MPAGIVFKVNVGSYWRLLLFLRHLSKHAQRPYTINRDGARDRPAEYRLLHAAFCMAAAKA